MRTAQQLYEGVDIKGRGTIGIITYLRTDSTRISDEAILSANEFIKENYGEEYLLGAQTSKKTDKKIQDAHEAIRPTDISLTPTKVKENLTRDQFRLYQLIWKRFVASRMAPAKYKTISVKFGVDEYIFTSSASKIEFNGYMSVYMSTDEDKEENNAVISKVTKESTLEVENIESKQHFTQPPAHFTEAALVKAMEEEGIGRPSTYAPTITTILARRYIVKENKNLYVTEIGEIVNKIMKQAFPVIIDSSFTANVESLLDKIEEGKVQWKTVIRNFYPDLDEAVKMLKKNYQKSK